MGGRMDANRGVVTHTNPTANGFFVYLEPAAASNVNACTAYVASQPVFYLPYPTSGAPTEAQKVMISQISLAVATGKPIKIYSTACSGNLNNIEQILLVAN